MDAGGDGTTLATGRVLSESGEVVEGATVSVSVVQLGAKDGAISFAPLGADTTAADGGFAVAGDLGRIRAPDRASNGSVEP